MGEQALHVDATVTPSATQSIVQYQTTKQSRPVKCLPVMHVAWYL